MSAWLKHSSVQNHPHRDENTGHDIDLLWDVDWAYGE